MRDYIIEWHTHEYEPKDKTSDWFWALGIISISIAVTAIILGNLLFAVLILVGAFALSLYAVRDPDVVHYRINQRGVFIDNTLYPHGSLDTFWVEDFEEKPKLLISSKKTFMPHIVIPVGDDVDRDDLRDYLLDHVDEEEQNEPLAMRLMEYLGF